MLTDVSPELWQPALQGFYKDDKILTQKVQVEDNGTLKVTFKFGSYDRTISSMGHVSAVQLNAALIEGLFIVAYREILSGQTGTTITSDNFIQRRDAAIFEQQPALLKPNPLTGRLAREGEDAFLNLRLTTVKRLVRLQILKMSVLSSGFLEGEAKCILPEDGCKIDF
jgi:hypothetical protein